jgi:hypothetical protein
VHLVSFHYKEVQLHVPAAPKLSPSGCIPDYKQEIILRIDRGKVLRLTKVLTYISIYVYVYVTREKAISNAK